MTGDICIWSITHQTWKKSLSCLHSRFHWSLDSVVVTLLGKMVQYSRNFITMLKIWHSVWSNLLTDYHRTPVFQCHHSEVWLVIEGVSAPADEEGEVTDPRMVCVCVCIGGAGGAQTGMFFTRPCCCVPRRLHGAVSPRSRSDSLPHWSASNTPLRPIGRGVKPRPSFPHRVWNDEWERGWGEKLGNVQFWFEVTRGRVLGR